MTRRGRLSLLVFATWTLCAFAPAQDAPPSSAGETLQRDAVRQEMDRIQNDPTLEAAVRDSAVALYQEALKAIDARETWIQKAAEFESFQESAPEEITEIRTRLDRPMPEPAIDATSDADLQTLRIGEAKARIERDVAQARVSLLANEDKRRRDRRQEVTQLLLDARSSLEGGLVAQDAATAQPAHPAVNEARSLADRASIEAAREKIRALEHEILSYDIRNDLLLARQEEAARQLAERQAVYELWQREMQAKRRDLSQEAVDRAQEALEEASDVAPRIREYAEASARENASLVERRMGTGGLLALNTRAAREETALAAQLEKMRSDFEELQKRVEASGSAGTLAPLFQNYREQLPEPAALARDIRTRERRTTDAQVALIELEERRREVEQTDALVEDVLAQLDESAGDEDREALRKILTEQAQTKKDTLSSLIGDYSEYIRTLTALNAVERDLKETTEAFRGYIRERALWMRSTKAIALADGLTIANGLTDAVEENLSVSVLQNGLRDFRERWYQYAVFVLPVLLTLTARRRLLTYYSDALAEGAKRFTATIRPTLGALLVALFRKAAWPVLFGGIGWRLSLDVDQSELLRAVGQGIMAVAMYGFGLKMIMELCKADGLAETHLAWDKPACERIRKRLSWYFPVTAPAIFLVAFCADHGATPWSQALGRVAIIIWCAMSFFLAAALLRPQRGGLSQLFDMDDHPNTRRAMTVLYVLVLVFLAVTIVLTCLGFHDTAVRLMMNMYFSSLLAAGAYLIYTVGARWFLMAKRHIALEKRRERAEKDVDATVVAEEKEELVRIDEQTRSLWRSACWVAVVVALGWVWAEQVPALQGLRNVELWTITETITETVTDAETNTEEIISREVPRQISLLELATALAIVFVGIVIVRNTPGFLETAFLRHLNIGSGERYAVNTLLQYIFTIIVAVWAFGAIGIGWGKVQWLAAALSVGLGFGLQEIFANFVSGLIVLFERPVRVGDLITINGHSGTVSKIKIRATTIRDFEKKELIVPNKDLVTGQLLNWTLTDTTVRIAIPFGIAYGSDVEKMEEVLWGVLGSDDRVLKDPAPFIIFASFGDNALNYEVYVFVALSDLLPVQNYLRKAIDSAFRDAGVEMAFPQRDVHFRNPLEIVSNTVERMQKERPVEE